jgi:polyisoprenyl-teichoic acid--peptidoglycan teichoic acid transferase
MMIMRIRLSTLVFLFLLIVFVAGCGKVPGAPPVAVPTTLFLVTAAPDSTPTLTPFQPGDSQPLATPIPVDPASQTGLIPQPAGQVSVLLLGSDQRPNAGDFRTDVIDLVTFRADHSVSIVSFPRDLYVYLPGLNSQRINAAMEFGGFDLVKSTFEYNFGISPQHFILTNFSGFKSIVDSLGGINVDVAQTLHDTRTGYPDGFTVYPGVVYMNGETALWYVRSRYSTSDFDRLRRAQEVIFAISMKLYSLNALSSLPEFYEAYRNAVVTDIALGDLVKLLPLLQAADFNRVDRYQINTNQATPWIDPNTGSYYLVPQSQAINQLLRQALASP